MNAEGLMTPQDVHLWIAFPENIRDPVLLAAYRDLMTDEERERQQRFHFERHRHQFLVTRALVRTTLSRYTGVVPKQWRFSVNRYGRPEIESPAGLPLLRFNLSHTDGIVICGVSLESDIGVDVEDTRRRTGGMELADRYFSPKEVRDLYALAPSSRRDRFFEYWTLKEAYIKARGMGLSIPLERFGFLIREGRPLQVSFDPSLPDRSNAWYFCLMQITARYKAAIALRHAHGEPVRLSFRQVVPLVDHRDIDIEVLGTSLEQCW